LVLSLAASTVGSVCARSLAAIQQSQEIRICLSPAHPAVAVAQPPDCRDDCTFSGPAYEVALAFVATLDTDIKPTFRRVAWDEQFFNQQGHTDREASYTPALLASGTCDLYPSNLTVTPWRLNMLDFVPLFQSRMMVVVNTARQKQFNGPADLAGKTAAVQKDTSFHTWLQAQNEDAYAANPVYIQLLGPGAPLTAVDAGAVDFTITDADAAIWSTRYQFKNAIVAFPVGPTDEIGWAFRKEDQDLQAAVAQFFTRQKASPTSTLNRIWENHFGLTLNKFETLVKMLR
jgi:membrane-bound lytic murein transglycosylase MltF